MSDNAALRNKLKQLIIDSLNLEGMTPDVIEDDAPLFGEGLGLDSVDALELVVTLEKEFKIRIEGEETTREAFGSLQDLAAFVEGMVSGKDPSSN
ncbi:MAG: acyl carrier protein [Thermoanaerobaculales bacterium]|nr:acyl carrier protein [Thermoanaerobaculales bacterium]